MENFVEDLKNHRRLFDLARAIYTFLEQIASNPKLDAAAVYTEGRNLHAKAVALVKEPDFQSNTLLHCLGSFLMLLGNQTGVLAGQLKELPKIELHVQTMIWLSSGAFRQIGNDLINILNFIDRRIEAFADASRSVAGPSQIERLRADEWARIALFVNGQILGFSDIETAVARSTLRWAADPVQKIRAELHDFKSFIERQAYRDIFVGGKAMENIARTLLQARLTARSYREVPTRGGRSDILAFSGGAGRILLETKIWRGPEYHETGIKELAEYVKGENDDRNLLGAFYVVFDPTETQRAVAHEGGLIAARSLAGLSIEVLAISLSPPTPSRKT